MIYFILLLEMQVFFTKSNIEYRNGMIIHIYTFEEVGAIYSKLRISLLLIINILGINNHVHNYNS